MKHKKLRNVFLASAFAMTASSVSAQLFIDNATFFIQTGATVTVQGDVTSNVDIQGPGKILLKGSANQNLNMNGFTIPNLEMDNAANATLTGNARIGSSMLFTNGKIIQGNFDVRLADVATTTGGGASKFFETTGTGRLVKEVSSNITNYVMPVGIGSTYYPASITTSGTYSSATVGVQGKSGAEPNKHPLSTDYLNLYWPITRSGVTGTVSASGNYNANFTGIETSMRGIFWNGSSWVLAGGSIDYALDNTATPVTTNGNLYAMNRFALANLKAYLQAPFNTVSGVMDDKLRTAGAYSVGVLPPDNLIPTTSPYQAAPYNVAQFAAVNNTPVETIASSVLNSQADANKNVVDWVFLELRDNAGPPSTVIGTRSALLLRDGSIVDIDGTGPVYFKDVDVATSFNVAVKHRNHLGIRTASPQTFALTAPALVNLTVSANLLGGFGATVNPGVTGLYAGNTNLNGNVRVTGASTALSDFEQLKFDLGAAPQINNTYSRSDVNMNRIVRVTGASITLSDFEYIKSVLGSLPLLNQPSL